MDLARIRKVVEDDGPFWTLHVDVSRASEGAEQQVEGRWTTIRHTLEHDGVDPALIEDIGARLRANHHEAGEVRRTLVAGPHEVLFDDLQPGHHHVPETADHDVLPDFSGWLTAADRETPFVLVVVDRTGADIDVYRATSGRPSEHESVQGETFYITKVAEGDWAQKQFQQTAENTWHHNAKLVADAVSSHVREHRPRAVLVAGDVRARTDVLDQLDHGGPDAHTPDLVAVEAGGRAAGSSEEALWAEVREILGRLQAEDDVAVSDRLEEARGRGEGAAHGVTPVAQALAESRVEHLVVDLGAAAEHTLRPADHPGLPLPAAAAQADEVRADRALVAAAALTGARLTLLPAAMAGGGGVAALLRWSEPGD